MADDTLSPLKSAILGGFCGILAPLSLYGTKMFQKINNSDGVAVPFNLPPAEVITYHAILLIFFAIVGAGAAYFLADGVKRHIFIYGIAGPYIVMAVIATQQASLSQQKLQNKQIENQALRNTTSELEQQVAGARGNTEAVDTIIQGRKAL